MPDYYVSVHTHVHANLVRSEYEKQPAAKKLSKHQPVISCYNNLEGQRPGGTRLTNLTHSATT